MAKKSYRVIIIGAGAAGMVAAIAAAEEAAGRRIQAQGKESELSAGSLLQEAQKNNGDVLLLESNDRAGKKILATGNGKCNFTHRDVNPSHYHTDDRHILEAVLSGYPTKAVLDFFERLGMLSREKNGYFYPLPETASTVLNVLRLRLSELGCEISCGVYIEQIEKSENGFLLRLKEKERSYQIYADRVILATGSRAGDFLQNKKEDPLRPARLLGLQSTPLYPSLTKCICREDHYYRQLAGVRAQVVLKLFCAENRSEEIRRESGELQLTKEGISGIAVFQLSGEIAQRLAEKRRVIVEINFLPDFPEDKLEEWSKKRLALLPGRNLEDFFLGVLHKKVLQACLQAEGLRGTTQIPASAEKDAVMMVCSVIMRAMHFTTEVTGVSDMRQAQVCRGGLYLSQFDEKLECRTVPGLFACGEVLNVDGECGGYNLHFAWASGHLAGKWAMRRTGSKV